MVIPRLSLIGALVWLLLALLTPFPGATAQAPPRDVLHLRIDADDYYCTLINAPPTEAVPLPERTATFDPPPTFTPPVFTSPTPTIEPTPTTQENATPQPPQATLVPKPTVTPTMRPTPATPPHSACFGTVTSATGLRVREWADLDAPIIGGLWAGQRVELFGPVWDNEGNKWHNVHGIWPGEGNVFAAHIREDDAAACWGLTEG